MKHWWIKVRIQMGTHVVTEGFCVMALNFEVASIAAHSERRRRYPDGSELLAIALYGE